MVKCDDVELVRKACGGEDEAFDMLVERYWQWAFAIAYGLTHDVTSAQDVVQEAFINSWKKLNQLTKPESFKQWLRRIVMNQAMIYFRSRKPTISLEQTKEAIAVYSEKPEQSIIKQETIELVNKAMQNLSLRHRLLLVLFYIDGLSQRDVGALLEVPEPIVKSRLHDARTKLRKEIKMVDSKEKNRRIVVTLRGIRLEPLGNESPKLEHIGFDVSEGEFFVLTGPQGCGAYEVLRIVGLLEKPDSGIVEIDGVDMSAIDPLKFVEMKVGVFGYIWQQPQLGHHMSAVENVVLPLIVAGLKRSSCIERSVEILRFVGLEDKNREVLASQLSVLDQQRIVLARALINDPIVIIAHEPTGNMGPAESHEFTVLLKRVTKERNVAVVCASHALGIIGVADRVAWMQNGSVAKIGNPKEKLPKYAGRSAFLFRYPDNICRGLYLSKKYVGTKKKLLLKAADQYEQAIQRVTILRGKPESTDEELINLQVSELQGTINLLNNAVSNLRRVLKP